jgi:hypothetical protein
MKRKRILVAATAAALAVAGAGGAVAATQHGGPGRPGGPPRGGAGLSTVTTYLGVSASDLLTQLRSGKSLAAIATANGKSVSGLVDALKTAAVKRLDAAVAAGKLTSAQETQIVSTLTQRLTDFVNGVRPAGGFPGKRGGHGPRGGAGKLGAAATYLGLSPSALMTQLRSGKSLAQIATAQGKTAAGLVDTLKTAIVKRLDAAVAAGKLTSAQETQIVSALPQRLTNLVNRTRPAKSGFRR